MVVLPTASLKTLFATTAVCLLLVLPYGVLDIPPRPLVEFVSIIAPVVAAISWLRADARGRHVPLVHDLGLFVWLAWPIVIPWYALRTRGRHGLPLALVISFAISAPSLFVAVTAMIRLLRQS